MHLLRLVIRSSCCRARPPGEHPAERLPFPRGLREGREDGLDERLPLQPGEYRRACFPCSLHTRARPVSATWEAIFFPNASCHLMSSCSTAHRLTPLYILAWVVASSLFFYSSPMCFVCVVLHSLGPIFHFLPISSVSEHRGPRVLSFSSLPPTRRRSVCPSLTSRVSRRKASWPRAPVHYLRCSRGCTTRSTPPVRVLVATTCWASARGLSSTPGALLSIFPVLGVPNVDCLVHSAECYCSKVTFQMQGWRVFCTPTQLLTPFTDL